MRKLIFALCTLLVAGSAAAQTPQPQRQIPQSTQQIQLTFAPVVKRVAPAVVNVYSRTVVQQRVNPFFQQFFNIDPRMLQRVQQSLGSGVIVRADGLILTNNHVIQGGTDIVVALADKREFKATVQLADARLDLAVLKIDTKGERLPVVPFGDSDKLEVGDLVLAIGDPFGVGQTVTQGIVSALARTSATASDYQFFIQTDAAINPGNSGGALVTMDGRLAGINTQIISQTGGNVGIGFAIPANLARRVVEGVQGGGGSARLVWIGADGQAVTSEVAKSLNLARPGGVLLSGVFPSGPVSNAGLKVGDIIQAVDGNAVDDMASLNYRVATHRPGDVVKLRVSSGNAVREVSVSLALPPESPPRELITISGRNPLGGAKVQNLSPAVNSDMGLGMMVRGVAVVSVAPNSLSGNIGFQPGDIIRSVNGMNINRSGDLQRALNAVDRGWDLVIERDGRKIQASF
jgi:serine protease Do